MPPDSFPLPPAELLAAFNRRWGQAASAYARYAPPPWWGPGLLIDRHLRQSLNRFIPIDAYLADLHWLLARALPRPAWVPASIRQPAFASIGDLWQELPAPLAGRLTWQPAELLPLACALASPPAFGTSAGRYPEQWPLLLPRLASLAAPHRVLDAACGTGQGTWELAARLAAPGALVAGITREPLEAWMAAARRLPHLGDPLPAEWAFPAAFPAPRFAAADLLALTVRRPFHAVVCNGLLGGPALHRERPLRLAVHRLAELLVPGGLLIAGDRFHAGQRPCLDRLHTLLLDRFDCLAEAPPSRLYSRR